MIVDPTVQEMETYFTRYDVKRLELYAQNMVDYHLIVDLLPSISRLYFLNQIDIQLSIVQSVSHSLTHKMFYWYLWHTLQTLKTSCWSFDIFGYKLRFFFLYVALYEDKDI